MGTFEDSIEERLKRGSVEERLKRQLVILFLQLVMFTAGGVLSLGMLRADILWTRDGYDIVVGGLSLGLMLSIMTTVQEWQYPILDKIFKRDKQEHSWQRRFCFGFWVVAWIIDIGTNWVYLLNMPVSSVSFLPEAVVVLLKLLFGAMIGAVELFFVWSVKAFLFSWTEFSSRLQVLQDLSELSEEPQSVA